MPKKGKILKVKLGYNPNSSSIGTEVVFFFISITAVNMLFNILTALVKNRFKRKKDKNDNK